MKTPKLSKPQLSCLREAARDRGCQANESYRPTARLLSLGLVTKQSKLLEAPVFRITEDGRKILQEFEGKGDGV